MAGTGSPPPGGPSGSSLCRPGRQSSAPASRFACDDTPRRSSATAASPLAAGSGPHRLHGSFSRTSAGPMSALVSRLVPAKRRCCLSRAASTRAGWPPKAPPTDRPTVSRTQRGAPRCRGACRSGPTMGWRSASGAGYHGRGTGALLDRVTMVTARTWVHRTEKHKRPTNDPSPSCFPRPLMSSTGGVYTSGYSPRTQYYTIQPS
jgi:hypothetical protein